MGASASFPLVSLRDRVAIVTGGNTGLGYEVSKWLAVMGASVIIACRSEQRALEAIARMEKDYEMLKTSKNIGDLPELDKLDVEFSPLELSSFTSTEKFADDFKKSGRPLHILICNAGIIAAYSKTDDGFEAMLQVNYLSHFLLTAKLLPVLLKSGDDCRVLHMSSDAHKFTTYDLDTMNYSGNPDSFPRLNYYGRSKLYQVMQTNCMARRLRQTNVTVNASHPGMVRTEFSRGFNDMASLMCLTKCVSCLGSMKTPLDGAKSVINGAVNPALKDVSGRYYVNCKNGGTTSDARNEGKQEALWQKTLEILGDRLTEKERQCLEGETTQPT